MAWIIRYLWLLIQHLWFSCCFLQQLFTGRGYAGQQQALSGLAAIPGSSN
ncbi:MULTISPECIES: hypothetical protein [Tatumella]|uniref:Uncharacterized protein n=1 Tax=Tatumella punctata TaxID=399969 RepID=A0ABW1VPT6_9GAMM|nr:hypothetical protein [Tatumella sp. JGM130]